MKFLSKLKIIVNISATVLLLIIMTITFIDVVGRQLFNQPLLGAVESSEICIGLMVFLLLPIVTLESSHITVDILDAIAGRILNLAKVLLTGAIGTILFGALCWSFWKLGEKAAAYGDATPSLKIPLAPLFYVISILIGALTLVFIYRMAFPDRNTEHDATKLPD
ncbi:TRAP transporter small permease [Sneathiella sp.]|uniref:TRAP transporter small permease n=1 Tax=Sneathiella sp. TaxID=1964365 RepID=UPI002618CE86|nr:TRAP transporter small permease [Sneathiella sp.]MDF2369074.1 TRAP transporter small permease [Sneathiella sp.]